MSKKPITKEDLKNLRRAIKTASRAARGVGNFWKWTLKLTRDVGKG